MNAQSRMLTLAAGTIAAIALSSAQARAADVAMKDGTHVSGDILEEQPGYMILRTADSTKTLNMSLVSSVDRTKASPEAAEGTHVSDVLGGREGTHFGFGGGGVLVPLGSTTLTLGAIALDLSSALGAGEVNVMAAYYNGNTNGTQLSGVLATLEYRLFFAKVYGLGLGPLVGFGSQGNASSKVAGFTTTPAIIRIDHVDVSLSFFFQHLTDGPSADYPGAYAMLSYYF